MSLEGFKGNTGREIRDRSIGERDLLRLPVTSITRNADGEVTEVVREGLDPNGQSLRVTFGIARVNGLVSSIARTYEGSGRTFTETETVTRDADGRVTSTTLVIS